MPTALELAQAREARKLRQAGFDPEGNPLDPSLLDDPNQHGDPDEQDPAGDDPSQLRAEIDELRRQLDATNGRVAPTQRQSEEYRQLWQQTEAARQREQAELRKEIESLRMRLEESQNVFDVTQVLTEEERAAIDPALLNTVTKLADRIAQHRAPKIDVRSEALRVMEERETNRVNTYLHGVLNDPARGLHQLSQLSNDPEFRAWLQEDDNDMDSVVNSLLASKSTEDVDRYARIVAKRILKYKERSKKPADAKTSLSQHMRREAKTKLTDAEVSAKVNEAKHLARSRNPADRAKAQQILNSLE
jgi:hypothetical protein